MHIHMVIESTLQESVINIKLTNYSPITYCNTKDKFDGSRLDYRTEGIIVINS
jgi:hypothetical protein